MVRWRYTVVLALLLLLPVKTGGKLEDDDEEENLNGNQAPSNPDAEPLKRADDSEEDDDDDEEDDEDEPADKSDSVAPPPVRKTQPVFQTTIKILVTSTPVTRLDKKRPLECYVCAYKAETPMRSCLDPTKYRVHTVTCHNPEDKCFTSIMTSKQNSYETVVRGCRSNCIGTPDMTCCDINRCNNQALVMPTPSPKALVMASKADKSIQPTVLFFVTILLVLQTVVRVAIV